MQVNIHEAKTHFPDLVERALRGEDIIIARHGKALLRLAPLEQRRDERVPGLSVGKGRIAEDFDAALDADIAKGFE